AGMAQLEYWHPEHSQLVLQAKTFWSVLCGHALYPSSRIDVDRATGRPPVNTLDFWWVYAWLTGVSRMLVAVSVGVLVVATTVSATWVCTHLRPTSGTRSARV